MESSFYHVHTNTGLFKIKIKLCWWVDELMVADISLVFRWMRKRKTITTGLYRKLRKVIARCIISVHLFLIHFSVLYCFLLNFLLLFIFCPVNCHHYYFLYYKFIFWAWMKSQSIKLLDHCADNSLRFIK